MLNRLLTNTLGVFLGNLSVITVISHYNNCPFVPSNTKVKNPS